MVAIPIEAIAPTVVNILVAFATKLVEGSGKLWGEHIFKAVKEKLSKKPAGKEAMSDFEKKPNDEDFQAVLRVQIKKALENDEYFRDELGKLLSEITNNKIGANFLQQFAGDNAKQFGNVSGSTIIIDESKVKAETRVGKNAQVSGDVSAVVNISPDFISDASMDEVGHEDEANE